MSPLDDKGKHRTSHAAEVLRRLDEIGAVNLGVLVAKSSEVQGIAGLSADDDDGYRICYPNYIHLGPRQDIDIVSVASQLRELGFEVKAANVKVGAQTKV